MRLPPVLVVFVLSLLACSGDFWRGCTSKVVSKTVETTKEVSSGVVEGVEDGRKAGQSVDGATLVSNFTDLADKGGIAVLSVTPVDGAVPPASTVVLALENRTDAPIRFMAMDAAALDKDGFFMKATTGAGVEITVPPRAKEKATYTFPVASDRLGMIRVWNQDIPVGAGR